ncbi:MAG TPA: gephyrin-like molybdotransferase receptor GlpR [Mycobacterium sp.]|jgi:hypothetical protein
MPSVPQSLLWISLVVLWLFVLVPMLISKREAVRRTSDVALATRVLNSGLGVRRKKGGPAAGHNSDPDWQPSDEDDDLEDEPSDEAVVVKAAEVEQEIIDVDVVDEEPAEPETEPQPVASAKDLAEDDEDDGTAAEYETVEDTSGLESEDEPPTQMTPPVSPRRLYESKTAVAVTARKYRFRRRMLSVMALMMVVTTVAAVTVWHAGWWACGSAGLVTIVYLAYLRRQTRIEEQVRRRRAQRLARSRYGVQNTADTGYEVPSRLRRPGAAVLEIDDEDPIFEHLDYAPGPMEYRLPRAAGE